MVLATLTTGVAGQSIGIRVLPSLAMNNLKLELLQVLQPPCQLGEVPISFLLDTGAAVTLLRKDAWERVNAEKTHKLSPWSGQRLVGVDGSPLQVFGQVEMKLTLVGKHFPTNVLVVSPLTTEAILGLDFLQHHRATINLEAQQLLIGRDTVTQIPLSKLPLPISKLRVQLVDAVRIPPCSA